MRHIYYCYKKNRIDAAADDDNDNDDDHSDDDDNDDDDNDNVDDNDDYDDDVFLITGGCVTVRQ